MSHTPYEVTLNARALPTREARYDALYSAFQEAPTPVDAVRLLACMTAAEVRAAVDLAGIDAVGMTPLQARRAAMIERWNMTVQEALACNCESLRCAHDAAHCATPVGAASVPYLGSVCDPCAARMALALSPDQAKV